jgi:hypothetical protein
VIFGPSKPAVSSPTPATHPFSQAEPSLTASRLSWELLRKIADKATKYFLVSMFFEM